MAFHLQTNEHLDRGMRRILRQQIDAATKRGTTGANGSTSRHVHRVRKHVKKMRAVLRLLRAEIGTPRFKVVNRRLRDMGRQLSAVRDAQVRVRTVDELCELFFEGRDEFPKIRRRLTRDSRDRARESAATIEKIGRVSRTVRREVRSLKVSGLGPARLRQSLHCIYKQARAAFIAARQDPAPNRLHELRKRLKDLWYDLRVVRLVFPEVLEEQARQAKLLTKYLGENLDLAVMREALTREKWKPDTAAEREALLAIIDARRPRLRRAALDLAAQFFNERPPAFARRVSAYFCNYRRAKRTVKAR
jgi:CHAD domain-containing protein